MMNADGHCENRYGPGSHAPGDRYPGPADPGDRRGGNWPDDRVAHRGLRGESENETFVGKT